MKSDEIYESWRQERRHIEVSQNFTDRVMDEVNQLEQNRNITQLKMNRLIELISFHPLAKTGLVAVGAVIGVVRVIIMILAILSNGVING
jgi:hypothetical protein